MKGLPWILQWRTVASRKPWHMKADRKKRDGGLVPQQAHGSKIFPRHEALTTRHPSLSHCFLSLHLDLALSPEWGRGRKVLQSLTPGFQEAAVLWVTGACHSRCDSGMQHHMNRERIRSQKQVHKQRHMQSDVCRAEGIHWYRKARQVDWPVTGHCKWCRACTQDAADGPELININFLVHSEFWGISFWRSASPMCAYI